MAKAGNLKLDFRAKSIGIHFFGFEDILDVIHVELPKPEKTFLAKWTL